MNSKLFNVDVVDVLRSVAIAVGISVLTLLYGIVSNADFNVFTADWAGIGGMVTNNAFVTVVSVLFYRFVSDEEGKLGGVI